MVLDWDRENVYTTLIFFFFSFHRPSLLATYTIRIVEFQNQMELKLSCLERK